MLKGKVICISIVAFMVLALLISPAGCTCKPNGNIEPEEETAKIEITFDPNPVPCEDGSWSWKITLAEVNGIGVNLTSLNRESHNGYRIAKVNYDELAIEKWLGSNYLPSYGCLSGDREWPREEGPYISVASYEIITIVGIDDNGYEVTASGRINILSP